jgi:predicted AAA+ superfamily ATPase
LSSVRSSHRYLNHKKLTKPASSTAYYNNRRVAQSDPAALLVGDEPRLIDEWQEAPGIWDAVRHEVDSKKGKGRFLLTGSTTPRLDVPGHSGTGRIARVSLRTMTLYESGESSGQVSLGSLLGGEGFEAFNAPAGLREVAYACVRGGWPESIELPPKIALRLPRQYLESIFVSDISNPDNTRRDPRKVAALVRALARCNAQPVTNKTLKWDVSEGIGSISAPTVSEYLRALQRIFILEQVPAWTPSIRARERMRISSKRYLSDPSLVVEALGYSVDALLADHSTFGQVFEGLCLRDLQVYAQACGAELLYYRDYNDLEVDAIVRQRDNSYAALEIKLTPAMEGEGARTLKAFAKKMARQGIVEPLFLCVVTSGGYAHQRPDGVLVVPVTSLKD